MAGKSYGINKQTIIFNPIDKHLEELNVSGFSIIENVFSEKELEIIREKLDAVYRKQEDEFGREKLIQINELHMVRCTLAYDDYFLSLATNEKVFEIVKRMLGDYFILHLQNGVINMPLQEHHQSSWHRDLPYQDFVISKPLAVSALICIDDFTADTGATFVLPFSHYLEQVPSEEYILRNAVQPNAKAGSVIVFDSMLLHKAGYNSSNEIRRGLNNVYVAPILKQQINIPSILQGKFSDEPFLKKFLGYESDVPTSVEEWRQNKFNKTKT